MRDIAALIEGFARFRAERLAPDPGFMAKLRGGQSSRVMLVGCSDSRVDPALLTQSDPGDLFVIRNVANLIPPYESGGGFHGVSAALEFGVKGLGVAHIVILGHGQCGGIGALLDDEPSSHFPFTERWMEIARPAKPRIDEELAGADRKTRATALEQAAIVLSLGNLLSFPFIADKVETGLLQLHGWYFDMQTGHLLIHQPETGAFVAPGVKSSAHEHA